jgi:hypothetical protein
MYCRVKYLSTDVSEVRATSIIALMLEVARTSETLVDNYFTRQYIPEDNSELHTRRRENFKSHMVHDGLTIISDVKVVSHIQQEVLKRTTSLLSLYSSQKLKRPSLWNI